MTTAPPIHVQLGLFGGCSEVAGMHVVSAHTRTLPDGSQVFVGEHLRWDRGRQPRPPSGHRARLSPDDHPTLFEPPRRPRRTCPPVEEIEVFPGAWQLPLWRT